MEGNKEQKDDKKWLKKGLYLYVKLTSMIFVSVIIGLLIGKWLDRQFGTEPWLFIFSLFISFTATMIIIAKEGMKSMK